ncbi:MAG: hypothetical protein QM784_33520 [Polyangiaceae bacterium]
MAQLSECDASRDPQATQLRSEWFLTTGRRLSEITGPVALLDERPLGTRSSTIAKGSGRLRIQVSGALLGNWLSEYSWSGDRASVELVAYEKVYGGMSVSVYVGKLTRDQAAQLERCASELSRACLPTLEEGGLTPPTIDGVESSFEYVGSDGAMAIVRMSPSQDVERRHLAQYNTCMCEILSLPFAKPGSAARVFCSTAS